jgi:hypothetical protein
LRKPEFMKPLPILLLFIGRSGNHFPTPDKGRIAGKIANATKIFFRLLFGEGEGRGACPLRTR